VRPLRLHDIISQEKNMLKKASFVVAILSLLILAAGSQPVSGSQTEAAPPGPSTPSAPAVATNLLVNGDFDQVGFYWRYPNHYVAGGWFEYWVGRNLPEFIDGGSIYHNSCYPIPPNGICGNNHSQGYIRWGAPYIAGIYQLVPATPCASYNFSGWVRNDQSNYHPKVGIDVKGTQLPFPDQDYTSHNCPPNGNSPCPNPSLQTLADMPQTIVWGPEFFNAPAFTWTNGSVTAEALSTTMGVWTFVAPEDCPDCSPSRSTYWDYASLVQVIPTTLSPDGRIPAPDGKISGLTVTPLATTAQIQWTTSQPAFGQVFYRLHPPAPSCIGTACLCPGTTCFVYTVYLPLIVRGPGTVNDFTFKTVPTTVPLTHPTVSLTGLEAGKAYDFVVMSRAFTSGACVSSVSSTGTFTTTP
jgi:hypothetical protein